MHYSVATTRWAIKAIAEHMGLTLTEPEEPMFRPLGFSRAGKHLVEQIRAMPDGTPVEDYARDSAAALARYMSRCNDYGQDILARDLAERSEEHTSELQSLMRSSYAVFCLKKKS